VALISSATNTEVELTVRLAERACKLDLDVEVAIALAGCQHGSGCGKI